MNHTKQGRRASRQRGYRAASAPRRSELWIRYTNRDGKVFKFGPITMRLAFGDPAPTVPSDFGGACLPPSLFR